MVCEKVPGDVPSLSHPLHATLSTDTSPPDVLFRGMVHPSLCPIEGVGLSNLALTFLTVVLVLLSFHSFWLRCYSKDGELRYC